MYAVRICIGSEWEDLVKCHTDTIATDDIAMVDRGIIA